MYFTVGNYLPLEIDGALYFQNLNFFFTQRCYVLSLVVIGQVVFNILSMYFRYFIIISPWKRAWPFIWTYWIPITQGCFVSSLHGFGQVVREKIFYNVVNVYLLFHNYLPWKRAWLFIWINLNSFHPRMHCAKFGWNWPSGSGEEDLFNFVNVFSL